MKYVSLDIETTCISPAEPKNILMISFVVEDTLKPEVAVEDLPHFTCYIKHEEPISGSYFALAMNAWILDIIAGRKKEAPYPIYTGYKAQREVKPIEGKVIGGEVKPISTMENIYWVERATQFLKEHFPGNKRITIAGKNVAGFDIPFLPAEIKSLFKHKTIDPATLFADWDADEDMPGLELCKKRAGINTPTAHDAREDALDVIRLVRFHVAKIKG